MNAMLAALVLLSSFVIAQDAAQTRNIFRFLETADEYFDYWGAPGQGRFEISGLSLPDPVLEKIYHKNAERLFSQFKSHAGSKGAK